VEDATPARARQLPYRADTVFNTLTDIDARPPGSLYFQKTRDTIEKRSSRWLKELARQSQDIEFDLNAWIPSWGTAGSGSKIPGRN
jgi:hypothetical protein